MQQARAVHGKDINDSVCFRTVVVDGNLRRNRLDHLLFVEPKQAAAAKNMIDRQLFCQNIGESIADVLNAVFSNVADKVVVGDQKGTDHRRIGGGT